MKILLTYTQVCSLYQEKYFKLFIAIKAVLFWLAVRYLHSTSMVRKVVEIVVSVCSIYECFCLFWSHI